MNTIANGHGNSDGIVQYRFDGQIIINHNNVSFRTGQNPNMRFDVSYRRIKNIPLAKPTIKKYLFAHVRSRFLKIDATEAAIAMYLPVQQFKKKTDRYVYGQSTNAI